MEKLHYLQLKDAQGMLDAKDKRGFKNLYIDTLQKIALNEVTCFNKKGIVLDFGCGVGRMCSWASKKGNKVIGLDINYNLLKVAKKINKYPNITYILYNGKDIPLTDKSVDIILCIGILSKRALSIALIEDIIAKFYRLLKSNGNIIVIEKVYKRVHEKYYKKDELINFFENNGFCCKYSYPIRKGHWLLLYLIQFGLIPKNFIPQIARYELKIRKTQRQPLFDYQNFLFEFEKKREKEHNPLTKSH